MIDPSGYAPDLPERIEPVLANWQNEAISDAGGGADESPPPPSALLETAVSDIVADVENLRQRRFVLWDKCAAFALAFGWGAQNVLVGALGKARNTVRLYTECGLLIPGELRVVDLAAEVYYGAVAVEKREPGRGIALLREVVESGSTETDAWRILRRGQRPGAPVVVLQATLHGLAALQRYIRNLDARNLEGGETDEFEVIIRRRKTNG